MRVAYAFLANAAEFTPDGRLNTLGGDYDTTRVSNFPFTLPVVSLVIKLIAEQSDLGQARALRVTLIDDEGHPIGPPDTIGRFVLPLSVAHPERRIGVGLVLNQVGLTFPRPGTYTWHVYVDDRELTTIALYVDALDDN